MSGSTYWCHVLWHPPVTKNMLGPGWHQDSEYTWISWIYLPESTDEWPLAVLPHAILQSRHSAGVEMCLHVQPGDLGSTAKRRSKIPISSASVAGISHLTRHIKTPNKSRPKSWKNNRNLEWTTVSLYQTGACPFTLDVDVWCSQRNALANSSRNAAHWWLQTVSCPAVRRPQHSKTSNEPTWEKGRERSLAYKPLLIFARFLQVAGMWAKQFKNMVTNQIRTAWNSDWKLENQWRPHNWLPKVRRTGLLLHREPHGKISEPYG